MAETRTRN